jgi:hypothetical protein
LNYDISHNVAAEKAWSRDVAKWGVLRILKDAHTGKVESERLVGLKGTLVVPLGAEERLVEVVVSPLDGTNEDTPIGASQVMRVLHDETPPRISMNFNVFRDASAGRANLVGTLNYEDIDPAAPECRDLRVMGSDGKESVPLNFGKWERQPSGKAKSQNWKTTFAQARAWEDPDVVSLRVVCSDPTGNLIESVASGRSDETLFELRSTLTMPKDAFQAVPRLGSRAKKRWILSSATKLDFRVNGFQANGLPLSGDVGKASLAGHTLEVVLKVEGQDDQLLLAGPATPSNRAELPASFSGDGRLEMRLANTVEAAEPVRVDSVDIFVPATKSPSLSLFAPAERKVAKKGEAIEFQAGALLDGLPFETGEHASLEWSFDGKTWEKVPQSVAETKSAPSSGEETWLISFPYPFDSERPAHFRLAAKNMAGKLILSEEVRNPFADKARIPSVSANDRAACGKARLRPVAISRYACLLVDAPTPASQVFRLTIAFQNAGQVPFALPPGSPGLGYEVRKEKGPALLEVKHGVVVTTSQGLNGSGLEDPATFEVDLPGWVLQTGNGESIRIDFDKETEGGHSLSLGNSCDAPDFFPFVEFKDFKKDLLVSPFPCE